MKSLYGNEKQGQCNFQEETEDFVVLLRGDFGVIGEISRQKGEFL